MTVPSAPFVVSPPLAASPLLASVAAATRGPEPDAVAALLPAARLSAAERDATRALARRLATTLRSRARDAGRAGLVQGLLQEFALSSQEGVALMCLAEALLRIPDAATRDALIRDKIADGDWHAHLGRSPSMFVNAASWGLLLTGKLVATHSERGLGAALGRLLARGGEPLIRKGVDLAMRLMGEQFVTGETIAEALEHARPREAQGFRYSYDMLGEAAMTEADAVAYTAAYAEAIDAIGHAAAGRGLLDGPGISIKLSALHPRYVRAQIERVRSELYPRLLQLALQARRHDIGFNIDAEEADRLELSLELLERLCFEPGLAGWNGIGFVVQAYQKRAPRVVDVVVDLARRSSHRLMVRLVKGAYWDSEIKRAQLDGLDDYPVYTRKVHTDVAYIACARALLAAPDAVYPQFAMHNAQTLAAVHTLADPSRWQPGQYEFQCLHGMGEPLYEQVVGAPADGRLGRPCRIYAPVGTHDTLLAYLVRRLLENGANTSFVNRIADPAVDLDTLIEDPVDAVEAAAAREGGLGLRHPAIPLPADLYGTRRNAGGLDVASEPVLQALTAMLREATPQAAGPMLADGLHAPAAAPHPVRNPADRDDVVGHVRDADAALAQAAVAAAVAAFPAWSAQPPAERAACLERAADALESTRGTLLPLLVREAGKTWPNAIGECREAVDFLRYYAAEVRAGFDNATHVPLGPVVCISPWNFPLAIFMGQVAAALAAGNVVLAKPAEQTPLVAARAIELLWQAGVPRGAVQLLPGPGEVVGAALVADPRVQGVVFTGSTEVARLLQATLAGRLGPRGAPVPLIAETGGQNALVVDSSALAEQVVADVLSSAFDSAGQRCSALRVLCVQEEAAPRLLPMLADAMRELKVGDPRHLDADVGPVIDAEARGGIERHVDAMRARGHRVTQAGVRGGAEGGGFVPPTLVEIERVADLGREVFGPVLHVLRYRREELATLLSQIAGTGYGLTFGVHTRIDETVEQVVREARAGNLYVNRNIVGAVVGVQPFGGEGLSGTGPKAGGPLYLLRLLATWPERAAAAAIERAAASGDGSRTGALRALRRGVAAHDADPGLTALKAWAERRGDRRVARACERFEASRLPQGWTPLRGPTGQADLYALQPREAVLCVASLDADRLVQTAAVLAAGGRALWPLRSPLGTPRDGHDVPDGPDGVWRQLPQELRERVVLVRDADADAVRFDAVLHHGARDATLEFQRWLARKEGPIVACIALEPGDDAVALERLVVERSVSVNTAAAGGNASLMTIG